MKFIRRRYHLQTLHRCPLALVEPFPWDCLLLRRHQHRLLRSIVHLMIHPREEFRHSQMNLFNINVNVNSVEQI